MRTFDKAEGGAIDTYKLDVNDSVALAVEFGNGALGVIHMSRFATGKRNDLDLMIHGEKGALKIWSDERDLDARGLPRRRHRHPDLDPFACPPTPRNEERFLIALLTGENGEPSFRHAAAVQKLLDLCFVSDAEGRMLPVT